LEFKSVAALFGSQQDHARKLEHAGDKLNDNPSEEWPECADEDHVVQLQEICCYSEGTEQIENEPGEGLRLYLPQVQETKLLRHYNAEQQENHECESAAPSPDIRRHWPDRQQQQSDHAQYERKD
jgi:hypothetical protein